MPATYVLTCLRTPDVRVATEEARVLLAAHSDDVSGVGYRIGCGSPSQFSRGYRRQFGAPPSQDAARLGGSTLSPAPALV